MKFSLENYDIEKKIQTNQINVGIQIIFLLQSSAPNFNLNFNLGLGLVLVLLNPATHPPPPTQPPADRESMILTN